MLAPHSRRATSARASSASPRWSGALERFNGSFRREVLDAWLFDSLDDVVDKANEWLAKYNCDRPHESLGDIPPIAFLTKRGFFDFSAYAWL